MEDLMMEAGVDVEGVMMNDSLWTGDTSDSNYNSSLMSHVNRSSSFPGRHRQLPWSREIMEAMRAMYSPWALNFDTTTLVVFVIAFSILIIIGALGNGLVCYVVARRPHMRTPRNIFITNLAVSDLILCLFTQPFNLMKISLISWPLGAFLCKFVSMMAATNVLVSTMSIAAIALDRFQVIVYPTKRDGMQQWGAVLALGTIWGVALLMASPLFFFNHLEPFPPFGDFAFYHVCVEGVHMAPLRTAYSVLSIILQYAVPIIVVTAAHARISNKLKHRLVNESTRTSLLSRGGGAGSGSGSEGNQGHGHSSSSSNSDVTAANARKRRERKTNLLLIMIALVFALSYLPLNITNVAADFGLLNALGSAGPDKELLFSMCNLVVLLSACLNALIYGWLNDNFRYEFVAIFSACLPAACVTRLPARPSESCYTTGRKQSQKETV